MKTKIQALISGLALAAMTLVSPAFGQTTTPPAAKPAVADKAATTAAKKTSTAATAKTVTPAPTAAEIADAKSKGMVWVNLKSGVFHKDGKYFGATKSGKFMTEADATKAGYKAAKEPSVKKPIVAKTTKPATK